MIDAPEIIETAPQLAAAIPLTIPRNQIQTVMGPGLTEIFAAVKDQGLAPAGPWFTHHLKMNPETFDFEICVPIASPVRPVGRVVARQFPALRVARTVHHGPYEQLGEAWQSFGQWLSEQGHATAPDLYECYLLGPELSPAPADWCTELRKPIAA